jgi:2-polyprenyl-3-methyl-5-hydroxy-6-metoxy-1,4-benzoquinol methylase
MRNTGFVGHGFETVGEGMRKPGSPFVDEVKSTVSAPVRTSKHSHMHWTPAMISRFWDWQSQYPQTYFTYQFGREIADALRRYLVNRRQILDFGCGVGYLLPHLCRVGAKVYGADPSLESVARANKLLAGTKGFEGAFVISELQERRVTFDAILAVEVIEHLYDAELDQALAAIRGMLNPDGIAIFTTPNDENLEANMILCPTTGEVFHRWQHVRSWNVRTLGERLGANQFEVVQFMETNLSLRQTRTPVARLKKVAKRLLYGNPGNPHLICVAKLCATANARSQK